MASRRSHAPTNDQQIEHELRVPQSGTYIMKPTASSEGAQLWVSDSNVSHRDTALTDDLLWEDTDYICHRRVRDYGGTP